MDGAAAVLPPGSLLLLPGMFSNFCADNVLLVNIHSMTWGGWCSTRMTKTTLWSKKHSTFQCKHKKLNLVLPDWWKNWFCFNQRDANDFLARINTKGTKTYDQCLLEIQSLLLGASLLRSRVKEEDVDEWNSSASLQLIYCTIYTRHDVIFSETIQLGNQFRLLQCV